MDSIRTTLRYDADLGAAMAQVKALTGQVGALNLAFNSLDKNALGIRNTLANTFAANLSGLGGFRTEMVNLTSQTEKFGKALAANKLSMREYFAEAYRGYTRQSSMMRQLAREQVKFQEAVAVPVGRNAAGQMQGLMAIPTQVDFKNASTRMKLLSQEFNIFNQLVRNGADELINMGKNTQWTGRQLTVGLTMPIVLLGATFAKTFMDIDKEMTRFAKVYGQDVVGTTTNATEQMKQQVMDLAETISSKYGVAAKETVGLAADIAATGKEGKDLLATVEQTNRLAVLGEVDRQEAMKATLAIQSAFKQNTDELTESINFLNAIENQTSTTLNDLVEAIPKAGPVVKGLGGSIKDLSVLMVAMKEGGIPAAEAANAIKSGMASLINPTKKASEVAKQFGVDLVGIVNANKGQLMPTLMAVQQSLDGLDAFSRSKIIEEIFGKYQFARISALFNNLGKAGSQTQQAMELAGASTTELAGIANQELKAYTESTTVRFQRMVETVKNQLIPMAASLLEMLTPALEKLSGIIDAVKGGFEAMPSALKEPMKLIAGAALFAGPVLMLVGLFKNLVGNAIKFGLSIVSLGARMGGINVKKFELLDAEAAAANIQVDNLTTSFGEQTVKLQGLNRELQTYLRQLQTVQSTNPQMVAGARPPVRRRSMGSSSPETVPGGYGGGDKIPALLEPGEMVVRKEAASKYGPIIAAMNRGTIQGFQEGTQLSHFIDPTQSTVGSLLQRTDLSTGARAMLTLIQSIHGAEFTVQSYTNAVIGLRESLNQDMRYGRASLQDLASDISETGSAFEPLKSQLRTLIQATGEFGDDLSLADDAAEALAIELRNEVQQRRASGATQFGGADLESMARSATGRVSDPRARALLEALYSTPTSFSAGRGLTATNMYLFGQESRVPMHRAPGSDRIFANVGEGQYLGIRPSGERIPFGNIPSYQATHQDPMRTSLPIDAIPLADPTGRPTFYGPGGSRVSMATAASMGTTQRELFIRQIQPAAQTFLSDIQEAISTSYSRAAQIGVSDAIDNNSPAREMERRLVDDGRDLGMGAMLGLERGYKEATKNARQSLIVPGQTTPSGPLVLPGQGQMPSGPLVLPGAKAASTGPLIDPRTMSLGPTTGLIYGPGGQPLSSGGSSGGGRGTTTFLGMPSFPEGPDGTPEGVARTGGRLSGFASTGGNALMGVSMLAGTMSMFAGTTNEAANKVMLFTSALTTAIMTLQMFSGTGLGGGIVNKVGGAVGGKLRGAGVAMRAGAIARGGTGMMAGMLGTGGRALAGAGTALMGGGAAAAGTVAAVAIPLVITAVGLYMYKKSLDEARERAIAAFKEPTKTAEFYGKTIKGVTETLKNIQSAHASSELSEINTQLREAVSQDYAGLIEKIKSSAVSVGSMDLAAAYNNMIVSGLSSEEALDSIKAIAAEAGTAGGLAYTDAFSKGLLSSKSPEESFGKMMDMIDKNSQYNVDRVAALEAEAAAIRGQGRGYGTLSQSQLDQIGSINEAMQITGEQFNATLKAAIQLSQTAPEVVAENSERIRQAFLDLSNDGGFGWGQSAKEVAFDSFKNMMGELNDPMVNKIMDSLQNAPEEAQALAMELVGVGGSLSDAANSAGRFDAKLAELALQRQKDINMLKGEIDDLNDAIAEFAGEDGPLQAQLEKGQERLDKLGRKRQRYVKQRQEEREDLEEAIKAENDAMQDNIDALQEEQDAIEKSADRYVKSIEKRQKADKFYADQRKSSMNALKSLAEGDIFGFLAARNEQAANATEYAYDQEIAKIEERKNAEVEAVQEQIDAKQKLMEKNQEAHDAQMKAFDDETKKQSEELQNRFDERKLKNGEMETLINGIKEGEIQSYKDITEQFGEEVAKRYEIYIRDLIKKEHSRMVVEDRASVADQMAYVREAYMSLYPAMEGLRGRGAAGPSSTAIAGDLGIAYTEPLPSTAGTDTTTTGAGPQWQILPSGESSGLRYTPSPGTTVTDSRGNKYTFDSAQGWIQARAQGGYISGPGTETSDSIPAYLSDGEYVIRASSVRKYGPEFFDQLNAGRFATGGIVEGYGEQQSRRASARFVRRTPLGGGRGDRRAGVGAGTDQASMAGQGTDGFLAVEFAKQQIGEPYSLSPNNINSWGCSSLTATSWNQGVPNGSKKYGMISYSATQIANSRQTAVRSSGEPGDGSAPPIPYSTMRIGDIVYFKNTGLAPSGQHVGLYAGAGKMIHAGNPVGYSDLSSDWNRRYFSSAGTPIAKFAKGGMVGRAFGAGGLVKRNMGYNLGGMVDARTVNSSNPMYNITINADGIKDPAIVAEMVVRKINTENSRRSHGRVI